MESIQISLFDMKTDVDQVVDEKLSRMFLNVLETRHGQLSKSFVLKLIEYKDGERPGGNLLFDFYSHWHEDQPWRHPLDEVISLIPLVPLIDWNRKALFHLLIFLSLQFESTERHEDFTIHLNRFWTGKRYKAIVATLGMRDIHLLPFLVTYGVSQAKSRPLFLKILKKSLTAFSTKIYRSPQLAKEFQSVMLAILSNLNQTNLNRLENVLCSSFCDEQMSKKEMLPGLRSWVRFWIHLGQQCDHFSGMPPLSRLEHLARDIFEGAIDTLMIEPIIDWEQKLSQEHQISWETAPFFKALNKKFSEDSFCSEDKVRIGIIEWRHLYDEMVHGQRTVDSTSRRIFLNNAKVLLKLIAEQSWSQDQIRQLSRRIILKSCAGLVLDRHWEDLYELLVDRASSGESDLLLYIAAFKRNDLTTMVKIGPLFVADSGNQQFSDWLIYGVIELAENRLALRDFLHTFSHNLGVQGRLALLQRLEALVLRGQSPAIVTWISKLKIKEMNRKQNGPACELLCLFYSYVDLPDESGVSTLDLESTRRISLHQRIKSHLLDAERNLNPMDDSVKGWLSRLQSETIFPDLKTLLAEIVPSSLNTSKTKRKGAKWKKKRR